MKIKITLSLSKPIIKLVKEMAKRERRSVSAQIEKLIEEKAIDELKK